MNPRSRVLSLLRRESVDPVPVDLWYTPEIERTLMAHFHASDAFDLFRRMGLDKIEWIIAPHPFPGEEEEDGVENPGGKRNTWGVPIRKVRAGSASYHEFAGAPLSGYDTPPSLDRYPFWPDPDRFDYDTMCARARAASTEFAVMGPWVSLFEIYCQMRGLETALLDLAANPGLVEAALDRIEAIQTEMMRRFWTRAAGTADLAFFSDDMGTQEGLIMSPEMWERHLAPRLARWCELAHGFGLTVFFHSDGAVEPLIPRWIECGIDVLNPIQHACPGMDRAALKRNYGRDLVFHGGVDNQQALPFGTPEEVRRETLECLRTLGAGGEGYMVCSCHNVQAGTPVENILAMVEAAREGVS